MSYTFNGAGERVSKTVNGTTTRYTWDPTGLGTVIADGTVENVFGPLGLAEQVTDSSQTPQFAQADALGSIRLITDGSGTVVGTGSYGAWGTPEQGSVTLGGFGFTSEQVDPETGFVYLRNRSYDPATSRFLTPDPLGLAGSGVNLYAYVGNNPVTGTDPAGLQDPFEDGLDNLPFGGGAAGGGAPESPGGSGPRAGAPEGPSGPNEFIGPVLPKSPAGPEPYEGESDFCPLNPTGPGFASGVNPAGAEAFGPEGEGAAGGTRITNKSTGDVLETDMIRIPGPVNSPKGKLDYLLGRVTEGQSARDSAGKGKFFGDILGFDDQSLDAALREHLASNFANAAIEGNRIYVTGEMIAPNGRSYMILSVWQYTPDGHVDLITAQPG